MAAIFTSTCTSILDLPPSCVAFPQASSEHFIVGTYELQKGEAIDEDEAISHQETLSSEGARRSGSLILFHLDKDNKLTLIQTLSTASAILDCQFHPQNAELFATADSAGSISLYGLRHSPSVRMEYIKRFIVAADPKILILSLVWHPTNKNVLSFTSSDGFVYLGKLDNSQSCLNAYPVRKHDYEAWTAAFPSCERGAVKPGSLVEIISGSDGADLCISASNVLDSSNLIQPTISTPLLTIKDLHSSGITSILPLGDFYYTRSQKAQTLLTGSYDDTVKLSHLTYRNRKDTHTVLASCHLGGGVWRLKLLEDFVGQIGISQKFLVLASCMHSGAKILRVSIVCNQRGLPTANGTFHGERGSANPTNMGAPFEGEKITFEQYHNADLLEHSPISQDTRSAITASIEVLGSFTKHQSMNYGSDARRAFTDNEKKESDRRGAGEPVADAFKGEGIKAVQESKEPRNKVTSRWDVASTSFYDRLLCIWSAELDIDLEPVCP
ncbi:MAG: hypothetical protein M1829_006833 [Trizodia sp. TS-e1964]|nr:MAG: hypothetical protein M1829_006833 [Trizodia sp. TS-e1964]